MKINENLLKYFHPRHFFPANMSVCTKHWVSPHGKRCSISQKQCERWIAGSIRREVWGSNKTAGLIIGVLFLLCVYRPTVMFFSLSATDKATMRRKFANKPGTQDVVFKLLERNLKNKERSKTAKGARGREKNFTVPDVSVEVKPPSHHFLWKGTQILTDFNEDQWK